MRYLKLALLSFLLWVGVAQADTLTVYPDAGTGNTTVDGYAERNSGGVGEVLAVLRAGVGTTSNDTSVVMEAMLKARVIDGEMWTLRRIMMTYDTSPLGGAPVDSASLFMIATSTDTTMGDTDIDIVSSVPINNNAVVAGDYDIAKYGSTVFSSLAISGLSTVAYNEFILNANGISNIVLDGISKFAGRTAWDVDNNFTGTWGNQDETSAKFSSADTTGTTSDPKLVMNFSGGSSNSIFFGTNF